MIFNIFYKKNMARIIMTDANEVSYATNLLFGYVRYFEYEFLASLVIKGSKCQKQNNKKAKRVYLLLNLFLHFLY